MIKKVDMYSAICDNCNETHTTDSIVAWTDDAMAIDTAIESGWIEHKGKLYCEDCYFIDDDNIEIIKKESPNE